MLPDVDAVTEPDELVRLGVRANAEGHPRDAEQALRRALDLLAERTDDSAAALRVRAGITLVLARLGDTGVDAAGAELERLSAAARSLGRDGLVTLARIQQAGLLARVGRWRECVELLEDPRADGEYVGTRELSAAAVNRGLARQYLGEFTRSEADLREGLALAREGGWTDMVAVATHNLGCLALLRGDVPQALALMDEAASAPRRVSSATSGLDMGRAHIEAGLIDDAVEGLWQALREATTRGVHQVRGEILLELARCSLIRQDFSRAGEHAESAGAVFASHRAAAWQQQAEILALQAALDDAASGAEPASAEDIAQRALALAKTPTDSPAVRHDLACLAAEGALRLGEPGLADRHLDRARQHRRPLLTSRLHRDLVDASVADSVGDAARRRRALHRAARRMTAESARFSALDSRTAIALHGGRLAALDLGAAMATGRPSSVLAATERWRAVSLRALTTGAVVDPELRDLSAELRLLTHHGDPTGPAPDGERVRSLERRISARERMLAASLDPASTLTPASYAVLRAALHAADTRSVSFFVKDRDLWAVSAGPGGPRVDHLGPSARALELANRLRADLHARAYAPTEALRSAVDRSTTATLGALDAMLSPALRGDAGRLVVVPSWVTPSIPWRMLHSAGGRPVTVAPSATFWQRASGATPVRRMAALGGPGTARADDEVADLAAIWPRAVACAGAQATADRFREALAEADVVHVAAHGRHDESAPHFSSVHLVDGPVFAHEFQRWEVAARHVVLASCDTGRTVVRAGDEALGLAASLLGTGAVRCVVAAVAPVDDEQTHALMTAYHRELVTGADAATALDRASHGIRDGGLFAPYGADWSAARGRTPT